MKGDFACWFIGGGRSVSPRETRDPSAEAEGDLLCHLGRDFGVGNHCSGGYDNLTLLCELFSMMNYLLNKINLELYLKPLRLSCRLVA